MLLLTILILSSLTSLSAGWFDNKIECDSFKMEIIDGFHNDWIFDSSDDAISMSNDKNQSWDYDPHLSLLIQLVNDTNLSRYENPITNYTTDNFIFYMTDEQETIAFMTKDNYTYKAILNHVNGTENYTHDYPAEYNEDVFMQDVELLKKYMSTIEHK